MSKNYKQDGTEIINYLIENINYPMIESPCNKICKIDPNDNLCLGCGRTLEEIAYWTYLDDNEKKKILIKIKDRFKKN